MVYPPVVERKPGSIEKMPRPVLPPGVTERDLEMFKKAQEKASQVGVHVYIGYVKCSRENGMTICYYLPKYSDIKREMDYAHKK